MIIKERESVREVVNVDIVPSVPSSAQSLTRSQILKFSACGYVVIRNLVNLAAAARFEALTRSLPARRVICSVPDVSWEEQSVPHNHPLYRLFFSVPLKAAMSELLGQNADWGLICWVSRYGLGEYISPHTDTGGTLQVLLMLRGVDAEQGGVLTLVTDSGNVAVDLRDGDALYFRATSITHFTTPLTWTAQCPTPTRVVAVGRYFSAIDEMNHLPKENPK
jgi:hypothetical protein